MILSAHKITASESSAGYTVLRKKLGIGTANARAILEQLQKIGLVKHISVEFPPIEHLHDSLEEYKADVILNVLFNKYRRRVPRWRVRVKEKGSADFDRLLLDKMVEVRNKEVPYPAYLVRKMSNEAARLLTLLHCLNDELLDLVDPSLLCVQHQVNYAFTHSELDIYRSNQFDKLSASLWILSKLYDVKRENKDEKYKALDRLKFLLQELEDCGLVKRVVMVFAFDSETSEKHSGCYELDIKTNNSKHKKEHRRLAMSIKRLAQSQGVGVDRADAKFYHEYMVAVPENKYVWVCTAFRLTFSVKHREAYSEGRGMDALARNNIVRLLGGFGG